MSLVLNENGWLYHGQPTLGATWNPETRIAHLLKSYDCPLFIEANHVVLKGGTHSIKSTTDEDFIGVRCEGYNKIVVEDLNISGFKIGIQFIDCKKISLLNCQVAHNSFGLHFENCQNSLLLGCTISYNDECGLYILHSTYNNVFGNSFSDNATLGLHIQNCQGNLVGNNHFDLTKVGIYVQACVSNWLANNEIEYLDCGICFTDHCKNNNLLGNSFLECSLFGMGFLYSTTHSIATKNTFVSCKNGVFLYKSSLSDILDNKVHTSLFPFICVESSGARLLSNEMSSQVPSPLLIYNGNQVIIEANQIQQNEPETDMEQTPVPQEDYIDYLLNALFNQN